MATEVQWSELQRDPKGVAALADQGVVRVRRRDGEPLLLIKEEEANGSAQGAIAAARTLRNIVVHHREATVEALRAEYAWLDLLPKEDQAQFATDFIRAVQLASDLGRWSGLDQTIYEWRATAEVYGNPELLERLTRPLDDDEDYGPVPPPDLA